MAKRWIDTHVHLLLSKRQAMPDWRAIKQTLDMAAVNRLDALCITEHIEADAYESLMRGLFLENKLGGCRQGSDTLSFNGVCVFPGAELELANHTNVGVHTDLEGLLALDRRAGSYTLEGVHERLRLRGKPFKLVAHHVFWPGKTCDDLASLGRYVHAIEVPAKDLVNADKYQALARSLELDTTGGSDAHTFIQVGACHTVFDTPADGFMCTAEQWFTTSRTHHVCEPHAARLMAMANIHRQALMGQ